MDTLNDLLAASDLVSLHCALTNETVQIINADCLQHIKPGKYYHVALEVFSIGKGVWLPLVCKFKGNDYFLQEHFLLILVAASYWMIVL